MSDSQLGFSSQDVASRSNGFSSVLSAQKKSAPSPGAGWFYGVIECERHSSFHGMDDTSRARTNCLFEKVMKYLLSMAGQISRRN